MDNKNFKWGYVLLGVVLAIALFPVFKNHKSQEFNENNFDDSVFQDPDIVARQLCFIWNTEAGDQAQLSMDLRGEEVIGEFNWRSAEKDSKTGIFRGTVTPVDRMTMSRTINAIWDVSAEGMKTKEELRIIFGEGIANVGFGEMTEDSSGIWRYADPKNLSYEPNLSDTDCGDEAMD